MKKQKVMSQMKGQDKTLEKQLQEVKIGNLPEKEFRKMIVKIIQKLAVLAAISREEPRTQCARGGRASPYLSHVI